jgi:hypothetical protein
MGYTQDQWLGFGEGAPSTPSKPKLKKGLWSPGEDRKLTDYILKSGLMGCWSYVTKQAGKHHVYSHFNHFFPPFTQFNSMHHNNKASAFIQV